MNYKKFIIIAGFLVTPFQVKSFFPINIFQPYDINLRPEIIYGKDWQFTLGYEAGSNFHGFQDDDNFSSIFCNKANILQLYQNNIDALAMLKGVPNNELAAIFGQQFNIDGDNGVRGNMIAHGDFNILANVLLSARWHLPYNLTLGFHIPYLSMELDNVSFTDLTQNFRFEDQLVKELLTNNLQDRVQEFGGLCLDSWKRTGFGDLVTMLTWLENFPQIKPALKNVRLIVRGALSWPTGKKQDEDLLLALPFGNDGTVGIIFGAGLDLTFANYLRAGGYIELLYQFSDKKERRIKTAEGQTDLFYLSKTLAYKEHGINEQFNLYLEGFRFFDGLSTRVTYQFYKKREDRLWLFNDSFDPLIANSAENLQDATYHNIIFFLKYEFDPLGCDPLSPQLFLFAKHGFNGKRAILGNTFGFTFSVSF